MLDNIFFVRHVAFNKGENKPNKNGLLQLDKLSSKIYRDNLLFNKIISSSGPLSIFTAEKIIEVNDFSNQLIINDLYLKKKNEITDFSKILSKVRGLKLNTLIITNGEFIYNFLKFLYENKITKNNPITLERGECYFIQFKGNEVLLDTY